MRRLPLFLFLALCALLVALAFSWWKLYDTKKAIELKAKENQELIYRNAALQADIQDLKNGNDAVQERARQQLGMIKRDEVFVQVMDQPTAVQPVPTVSTGQTSPTAQANQSNPSNPASQTGRPSNSPKPATPVTRP
jgi:cell division protein FtsB